ncbi:hypothetical protein O6H91_23G062600 [Diphasiastrum complanatum]|uniref:Uncharacterized protein n=1 Tax=Diphasiastrum complanatum TaxID=34168 RepID=A0ACC2ABC0_DIPCM|nr:hypothetical protein O6H91_23G062600 [Diphasiastrum complanatum]
MLLVCNGLMVWMCNACRCAQELRPLPQVFSNRQSFSYVGLPTRTNATAGKNPRLLRSRRLLLSKQRNWDCPCTSIFYNLQTKPQHCSCKLQYIWSMVPQYWHNTNGTNGKAILESECSALIVIAALLGFACLGLLALLCAEKQGRGDITHETIKHRSVRETLKASLPEEISYRTVRKITNSFNHVLGDGGFGMVYNGELKDGNKVAVKVLDRSLNQGEKEFRAEVIMMATTQHVNVMPLRGFCSESTHRILVYEFMPNGSLDKWLFKPSEVLCFVEKGKLGTLDWSVRFDIAIGTARGLAYLHEERPQPIIHLDVKPENILLDVDFTPKLADFGLSRLVSKNQSRVVTKTRGTPGYLAPEWVHRSSITTKVDVFSFGMVLLELVCGREVIKMGLGPEQWYLPAWVVHMVEEERTIDVVDRLILEEVQYFYEDQIRRTIDVALCCIQEDPTLRPRMSRAVQMLEGVIEAKSPLPTKRIFTNTSSTKLKEKMDAYMDALAEGISDVSLENSGRSSKISSAQRSGFL